MENNGPDLFIFDTVQRSRELSRHRRQTVYGTCGRPRRSQQRHNHGKIGRA